MHELASPWVERATAELARAGYRRGGARQAVVELLGSQTCALSAVDIEEALREGDRRVARASVYRILDELERTLRRVSERVPFAVEEHEVVLHGRCGSCSS